MIILDIDNTLYYNPQDDFSIEISFNNIIPYVDFFSEFYSQTKLSLIKNSLNILITGRKKSQKRVILEALKLKGYNITYAFFYPFNTFIFPNNNDNFTLNSLLMI